MRPAAAALLLGSWLYAVPGSAGHGLLNAFADIEWLPPAGLTPDALLYPLDVWDERACLLLAGSDGERLALGLRYAREKLAEVQAMVEARNADAANVAIAAYRGYVEQLTGAPGDGSIPARAHERAVTAALLEHQYIMSTMYIDLPRETRPLIAAMMNAAAAGYARMTAALARRDKEALFFKEEEVRWSWDMAQAADAQGL